jgi:hypothetical protein
LGNVVSIVRPDVALQYVSQFQTVYTSERLDAADKRPLVSGLKGYQVPTIERQLEQFPLIRPRLPDSDWQLETVGQESYLGRAARRVRATCRSGAAYQLDARRSGFWSGVGEYECVMDDELQILLSVTAFVDGATAATISVEQVTVDEPIPTSTFEFSPPAGTRFAQVGPKNQ